MKKPPENRVRDELIAMRKDLGFSMEKMAKALNYSSASSYQYYESDGYTKDYVDHNFLMRLKNLVPLGINERRINALAPPSIEYKIDEALMRQCSEAVLQVATDNQIRLPLEKAMATVATLYNYVMKRREKQPNIQPDEGMASFVLEMKQWINKYLYNLILPFQKIRIAFLFRPAKDRNKCFLQTTIPKTNSSSF